MPPCYGSNLVRCVERSNLQGAEQQTRGYSPLRCAAMTCRQGWSGSRELKLQKTALGRDGDRKMRFEVQPTRMRPGSVRTTVLQTRRAVIFATAGMRTRACLGGIRSDGYHPGTPVRSNRHLLPQQQAAQQQADAAAKEFTSVLLSIHVRSVHPSIVSVLTQVRLGQSARGQFRIQDRTATQSR